MARGELSNCRILYHNAKSGTVPLWYDFVREFDNSGSSMPGGMSRKQGPRAAGMRPAAIAAGRRQWQRTNYDNRTEGRHEQEAGPPRSGDATGRDCRRPPTVATEKL